MIREREDHPLNWVEPFPRGQLRRCARCSASQCGELAEQARGERRAGNRQGATRRASAMVKVSRAAVGPIFCFVVKRARFLLIWPEPSSIAQPLSALPSMAPRTSNPDCETSAVALAKSTGTALASPDRGVAVTFSSLTTKLPLGARPGPELGYALSASASSRNASISLSFVSMTTV